MKTLKLLKITALTLLFVGFSQVILAQGNPDRPRMNERMMQMHQDGMPHMRIPDLTDEQKEQIKSIMLKTQEEMIPLKNQLGEKRARLRTLSTGDNVDVEAAESVIEEIGSLRTEIMKKHFAVRQEVRALLTDYQRVWMDSHYGKFGRHEMHHRKR
jgi:Spy/CpxP family protein refolding chaperone